jgi:hypothetical protein
MPYSKHLCFYSFVTLYQKENGGNNDLHPVKVITADTHAEWSAKEGVPSGMVRSTSWCISLSHYVVNFLPPPTHG